MWAQRRTQRAEAAANIYTLTIVNIKRDSCEFCIPSRSVPFIDAKVDAAKENGVTGKLIALPVSGQFLDGDPMREPHVELLCLESFASI